MNLPPGVTCDRYGLIDAAIAEIAGPACKTYADANAKDLAKADVEIELIPHQNEYAKVIASIQIQFCEEYVDASDVLNDLDWHLEALLNALKDHANRRMMTNLARLIGKLQGTEQ